jgi:hypothetical protein
MAVREALGSGFAGAAALTALHETVRRYVDDAPRMDVLGERAIERGAKLAGIEPPRGETLHQAAMAGDLAANSLYYSLVAAGRPETAWVRGAALGLAAGLGAVFLPGPMGLGEEPSNRTGATRAMTIGWYLLGGVAAGAAYSLLGRRK